MLADLGLPLVLFVAAASTLLCNPAAARQGPQEAPPERAVAAALPGSWAATRRELAEQLWPKSRVSCGGRGMADSVVHWC